nr:MAG TPA: TMC domain [Caudoviricetes sp.]
MKNFFHYLTFYFSPLVKIFIIYSSIFLFYNKRKN